MQKKIEEIEKFFQKRKTKQKIKCWLSGQLLMGGIQEKLISLDIDKVKEIQVIDTGQYSSFFVSGSVRIRIRLDPYHLAGSGSISGNVELDPGSKK